MQMSWGAQRRMSPLPLAIAACCASSLTSSPRLCTDGVFLYTAVCHERCLPSRVRHANLSLATDTTFSDT